MNLFVSVMAVLFALFLIFKIVVGINKNRAMNSFSQGYAASTSEELWQIIEKNTIPAFTSFNVASAVLGRLSARELPDLNTSSVKIAFEEQWNSNAVMIRAQQLDRTVSECGKDNALHGMKESISALY